MSFENSSVLTAVQDNICVFKCNSTLRIFEVCAVLFVVVLLISMTDLVLG